MTAILGISAFYHDSAAVLVVDGDIVAAAQEERFTRKKHDYSFPIHAITYCLEQTGLDASQLDYVGFYDKPLLKFDRLLETYLAGAPRGLRSFMLAMPVWLKQKLHLRREIKRGLQNRYRRQIVFTEHHESHAGSAFFPSPFQEAAILTLDGVGEWATASMGFGRDNRITLTHEMRFPHSLGLLYSAFTYFCGFKVNSGEYKLMGLAPYGEPRYAEMIFDELLDLKEDGSFRLNPSYFDYCHGLTMTSRKFDRRFGGRPRRTDAPITQREMDLAASIQVVTEEVVLRCVRHLHRTTGMKHLCLAGGVALNCVANGRILREGPFEQLWIQPAASDAGGALGTALFIWHQLLDNPRVAVDEDSQHGSLLGPHFTDGQIRQFLDDTGAVYDICENDEALCDHVADLLAQGRVAGWMQGRMEFGPRALGNRSILGDPRDERMQSIMNRKIKFRESFRPFAPSVLRERAADYFNFNTGMQSPYMLLVTQVHESRRVKTSEKDGHRQGLDKLSVRRSDIPAVTHVDGSARIQTVDADRHGLYYRLVKAFEAKTGCPLVINTSFNVRGEPIVCTPNDAYRCFMATHMDVLVMNRFVLQKDAQPKTRNNEVNKYLARFEPD